MPGASGNVRIVTTIPDPESGSALQSSVENKTQKLKQSREREIVRLAK